MADLSLVIPIITFNINDLSTPIRRQNWQSGLKKHDPTICCSQEINFKNNTGKLKVKGWKKIAPCKHEFKRKIQREFFLL